MEIYINNYDNDNYLNTNTARIISALCKVYATKNRFLELSSQFLLFGLICVVLDVLSQKAATIRH